VLSISFATSKGGAGKSTACFCIAGAYARAGAKVHIIDLDANADISTWLSKEATRPPGITFSTCEAQELGVHMQDIARSRSPDLCLIDLAGAYEVALSIAAYRSDLTIIPVNPSSEAEIRQADRVAAHMKTVCLKHGRKPFYRVLLTRIPAITNLAQIHGRVQVRLLQLPKLATGLRHRTAYEEIGYSGLPPHFAPVRETTAKAIKELDGLKAELDRLLDIETIAETTAHLEKTA
jgi:chromosome partitioning protein